MNPNPPYLHETLSRIIQHVTKLRNIAATTEFTELEFFMVNQAENYLILAIDRIENPII